MPSVMPDLRQTILSELGRRGWSKYQLTQSVKGKVGQDTVYRFLSGKRAITHTYLEPILESLGLEVRRKR